MTTRMNELPAILDQEIGDKEQDKFGHVHFAEALKHLIEDEKHTPPYSIGLLGGWGTGKSTIKKLYLNELINDTKRNHKIMAINFNAWRYGGENIKRSLLVEAYAELGGEHDKLWDQLFTKVTRNFKEPKGWKEVFQDLRDKWFATFVQLVMACGILAGTYWLANNLVEMDDSISKIVFNGFITAALWPALRYLFDPKRYIISRLTQATRVELPLSTAIEYEKEFLKQLEAFKNGEGRSCQRIVVFVDDLDRLSSKEMVDGLDAVRAFMEMNSARVGIGLVFVISCDEDRVAKALKARDSLLGHKDLPGAVLSTQDARRYLDRLFQFRLEIPKPPQTDMRLFAQAHFQDELKPITAEIAAQGESIETLVMRLIHINVVSPRNAIQLINAFSQAWWIAKSREFDGAGSEKPGGLREGSVTNHPLSLAAMCVLKVDFPTFFADLQNNNDLLNYFIRVVFFNNESFDKLPTRIQRVLKKYLVMSEKESNRYVIKDSCDSLRTYISSIRNLSLPDDIGPLLSLTENPISRNLSGSQINAYRALVSGDALGFLSELGHLVAGKPFNQNQLQQIERLMEKASQGYESELDLAFTVISQISSNIPQEAELRLLRPLVRRLSESRTLREMSGLEETKKVISKGSESDQVILAGQLVDDFCKLEGDVTLDNYKGGKPSLEQCVETAKLAVEISLSVMQRFDLEPQAKSQLMEWMEIRRVSYGGHEEHIPFSVLDDWVDTYQDHLLEALGSRYTVAAIEELKQIAAADLTIPTKILDRCNHIFEILNTAGNRQAIWDQLIEFIHLVIPEAVELGLKTFRANISAMDSDSLNEILIAVCDMLTKDYSAKSSWENTVMIGLQTVQSVLDSRRKEIGKEGLSSIGKLATKYTFKKSTKEISLSYLSDIWTIDKEIATPTITQWIERLLKDLPQICIEWISRKFAHDLPHELYQLLHKCLTELYARDNVTEQEGNQQLVFMKNIPTEHLKEKRSTNLINALITQITTKAPANPNQYLNRIFPTVPYILDSVPEQQKGAMLHNVFANAANKPELLGFLHGIMKDHWPVPTQSLAPYNPAEYEKHAEACTRQNVEKQWVTDVLESICFMLTKGVINKKFQTRIIDLLAFSWPHHKERVTLMLSSGEFHLTSEQLVNFIEQIDVNNEDDLRDLKNTWQQQMLNMDRDRRREIMVLLLNKAPKDGKNGHDIGLSYWTELLGSDRITLLSECLLSPVLNNDTAPRIWRQIELFSDELTDDFFIDIGPVAMTYGKFEPLSGQYFKWAHERSSKANMITRRTIVNAQIEAYPTAATTAIKRRLLEFVQQTKATQSISQLIGSSDIDEDDIELFKKVFGEIKTVKKIERSFSKNNNTETM